MQYEDKNMKPKTPSQSEVTMSELVLPNDTNLLGNLIGGRLMYWMDIAGALVASRHSNRVVATVSIDILTNQAKMVFVALDEAGVPVPVPPLVPQTEEEKELYEEERQKRLAFKK
jgi:acyl-CoA hydrolase